VSRSPSTSSILDLRGQYRHGAPAVYDDCICLGGGADPSVRVWDRYEDVLARQLRRDDFHFVALAVTAAERTPMLFAEQIAGGEKVITLSEIDRSGLENIRDAITRGQIVLGKQLGPWPAETQDRPPPTKHELDAD
jgi:hypothetical protein